MQSKINFKPQAIFIDIDGVMTSGHKSYDQNGMPISKFFYDKDFTALKEFSASGVSPFFITGDPRMNQMILKNRGYDIYDARYEKKNVIVNKIAQDLNLDLAKCLAIGDDIFDLPMLEVVGMAICPNNSHFKVIELIKKRQGIVLKANGGSGCLVEIMELLHQAKISYNLDVLYDLDAKEKF